MTEDDMLFGFLRAAPPGEELRNVFEACRAMAIGYSTLLAENPVVECRNARSNNRQAAEVAKSIRAQLAPAT